MKILGFLMLAALLLGFITVMPLIIGWEGVGVVWGGTLILMVYVGAAVWLVNRP